VEAIAAMDGIAARRLTEEHLGEATEWLLEAKEELG
jgi:DNA-binding FadR family transcriptional regulator